MLTLYTTYSTQFFVYLDGINKLVYQTIMLNAEMFRLRLVKLYTGNANWAAYFIPTKRMIIYGRPLGAKWNIAAVFVWIFHLGVNVSPLFLFMFLLALTYMPYTICTDHVKLLQIFRKSVCLEPSWVQTAKLRQTQMLLFTAHHTCFCTSCIVPAAFTTRTCITYHLVTAFKPLLINFCYYLLQLISKVSLQ